MELVLPPAPVAPQDGRRAREVEGGVVGGRGVPGVRYPVRAVAAVGDDAEHGVVDARALRPVVELDRVAALDARVDLADRDVHGRRCHLPSRPRRWCIVGGGGHERGEGLEERVGRRGRRVGVGELAAPRADLGVARVGVRVALLGRGRVGPRDGARARGARRRVDGRQVHARREHDGRGDRGRAVVVVMLSRERRPGVRDEPAAARDAEQHDGEEPAVSGPAAAAALLGGGRRLLLAERVADPGHLVEEVAVLCGIRPRAVVRDDAPVARLDERVARKCAHAPRRRRRLIARRRRRLLGILGPAPARARGVHDDRFGVLREVHLDTDVGAARERHERTQRAANLRVVRAPPLAVRVEVLEEHFPVGSGSRLLCRRRRGRRRRRGVLSERGRGSHRGARWSRAEREEAERRARDDGDRRAAR
mmetsp:Transcript_18002/g.72143  ORF Transcript_18002/g.72143 Transcript_18002/m.72143 type:complete len:422 (-) Transcript_18002:194-1459(-)